MGGGAKKEKTVQPPPPNGNFARRGSRRPELVSKGE